MDQYELFGSYQDVAQYGQADNATRRHNLDRMGNGERPDVSPAMYPGQADEMAVTPEMEDRYGAMYSSAEIMAKISHILGDIARNPRTLPGMAETHLEQMMIGG